MEGRLRGDEVVVGGDARQRFYDSRGYGRPLDGNRVALARVEAAHLLYRGDLDGVDGAGFREFLAAADAGFAPRFLVYKDLRDRGFYLSPAVEGRVEDHGNADFVVYPRGKGPWDDEVRYRVRAVGERASVPVGSLGDGVLAVVDEESEITYLETDVLDPSGGPAFDPPAVEATLLDDRAVVWEPPASLHERGFYGQPLDGRDDRGEGGPLHLSLVEAAYLAAGGALELADGRGVSALVERGRTVEGDRFDRRLRAYRALRDRSLVPKTGFKFGSDFRVYREVESVSELGHAEYLVRVVAPDRAFSPRDLALDVRLAHGVRKQMVFARDAPDRGADAVDWLTVSRLTP